MSPILRTAAALSLVLAATGASAAKFTPFEGENCQLEKPPAQSGEDNVGGQSIRIFPRKRGITPKYGGCMTVWAPTVRGAAVVGVTKFSDGKPVAFWSPYDKAACTYDAAGKVTGAFRDCPEHSSLVPRSLPSGCAEKTLKARGPVAGCAYD